MAREHDVVLAAVPANLVHPAPAAGAHETEHAALVDDLQRLGEVRVEQEVQAAQLIVAGGAGGGDGGKYLLSHALHGACLHCGIAGSGRVWQVNPLHSPVGSHLNLPTFLFENTFDAAL